MGRKFNAAIFRSLLRVKVNDEEIWRSDEDGRHFKIETETGEIKAGFGGKLNGVKIKPKGERTEKPAEVTKLYETKGFKAISHNARDYKDYNSFVKSLTTEQRDLLQKQHRRTDTSETLKEYTERMRKLMAEHPAEEIRRENKVVEGKDILPTFERRKDKFKFEIDDVVDAQGFNGVPKVVPKAEFDKAVKEANGGKGFIAQRTYSAPNQATLDSYRDMLYHGDWYINCETGGAQYGQGMYCAADYEGDLTDGIRAEMLHYKAQYEYDTDEKVPRDDWMDTAVSHLYESAPYAGADFLKWANDNKDFINKWADAFYDRDHTKSKELMERVPSGNLENLSIVNDLLRETPRYQTTPSFTETFTLDPSAKIIEYNQLRSQYFDTLKNAMQKVNDDVARDRIEAMGLPEDEANYLRWKLGVKPYDVEQGTDYIGKQSLESKRGLIQLRQAIESDIEDAQADDRTIEMLRYMDMGVYATMMGYDAINAENHGESGSYTVVLNRTKCIFLEP